MAGAGGAGFRRGAGETGRGQSSQWGGAAMAAGAGGAATPSWISQPPEAEEEIETPEALVMGPGRG